MDQILAILPQVYTEQLSRTSLLDVDELHLAAGQPLLLLRRRQEQSLWPRLSQAQLEGILRAACQQSIYAYAETLRSGFLTLPHGHRVGVCGSGVYRNGEIITLRAPSSLLIRVAHAIENCARPMLQQITDSVLIIGPPGSGKTTLLRDFIRLLSEERKERVGVADERGELAACLDGVPQLPIGSRNDVMVNLPKSDAIMMLLRTMAPQWIAVDEITSPKDIAAMLQASFCGVRLIATAHCAHADDLTRRPLYRALMSHGLFRFIVALNQDQTYTIQEVSL